MCCAVFNIRNTLAETTFVKHISAEDAQTLKTAVDGVFEWLEESGDTADTDEFKFQQMVRAIDLLDVW